MRVFASLVAALCVIGFTIPAQAIGMQFCDDIKDDQARMACLQQHITHLEETIVVLGGRVAALENALQKMLAADASYKLKSVAQGKCLGLGGDNKDVLTLVTCDNPDSWSVMSGAPIKKPAKTAAPAADAGTNSADSAAQPTADASKPGGKGANPCKNLDPAACAAKADTCVWRTEKNKCGRKDS
jgi:hypothetical protein